METDISETCKHCTFYYDAPGGGQCRRRSPQFVDAVFIAHFPIVQDYWWCGEWEPDLGNA